MRIDDFDKQNTPIDPEEEKGIRNNDSSLTDNTNSIEGGAEEEIPDLDGDGMIGNTGGFYGGTSYLGSNYTEQWGTNADTAAPQNEGNFGAAGVSDLSEGDEDNAARNSEPDTTGT